MSPADLASPIDFLCLNTSASDDVLTLAALLLYGTYRFHNTSRHSPNTHLSPLPYVGRVVQEATEAHRKSRLVFANAQSKRFRQ